MGESSGRSGAVGPLLETKLYVPRLRSSLVPRPRLTTRLDDGATRRLTIVCAPAGSGKTTLLADWAAGATAGGQAVAWVSLDRGDNDPAVFWSYVVSALRTVRPDVGGEALELLAAPRQAPTEWALTSVINELSATSDDVAVILDDYHVIEARPVHDAVAFLADNLPPHVRLIIATRADPPLPLARLRGLGELSELRAAQLRFAPGEAAAFLNDVMDLGLSAADVTALETRTEGWIVGLQLAALSMQGREDATGFVRAFAGDDRYIVDYLVDEVLRRQSDDLRTFLLQTSILDRLSGPLCEAVTGQQHGQRSLDTLDRNNVFVVRLDDQRRWFRYHHLFADVLRAHAPTGQPEALPVLHRRASEWYERNGWHADAVRHAVAARDPERAVRLLERSARDMLRSRRDEFLRLLQALPDEVVGNSPVLSAYHALALLSDDLEAAAARIRDAEAVLGVASGRRDHPDRVGVVDDEALRSLPGTIAIVRAYLAGAAGDVPASVRHATRALALLPADDHVWRGGAASLLGLAHWTSGDLEAAYDAFADAAAALGRTGDRNHEIGGALVLAELRTAQGRLREAARLYQQALEAATDQVGHPSPAAADLYVGLSELRREHDDLDAAAWCLQQSSALGEHAGLPEHRYRWYVAKAGIVEARGDPDGALGLLDEAQRRYIASPDPDVRPVAAVRARVWLGMGRLDDALEWARERELSSRDELTYLREFEHLTLTRALIARHRRDREGHALPEALALLERIEHAADAGGRLGSRIEALAVRSLAHQARGSIPDALPPLGRALELAAPEGYVRIFVDEGSAMRTLLRHAAAAGIGGPYTRRLLSAFDRTPAPAATTDDDLTPGLAEPLTPREVEILRLIAAGMRNQQIADHLVISLSTVKRHIANTYRKLGVGHRTEAMVRADELHLLSAAVDRG